MTDRRIPRTDSPTEVRQALQRLGNTFFDESSDVVHDETTGFVAAEHVNHSAVSILAGTGLAGGGTIETNRTLALSHLGIEALADPGADRIAFWDESENAFKWLEVDGTTVSITDTTLAVVVGGVDHGGLAGLGDDDHAQYLLAAGTRALAGNLSVDALITIDGRDLSVDGAKLDGIEDGADQTDATNVEAAGAAMAGGAFHDGFSDFVAAEHVALPALIAAVLTDHNLAAHTGLGLFSQSSDVDHDLTTNFVANKHIDWTGAASNLSTSGSIAISADSVNFLLGEGGDVGIYYDGTDLYIDPRLDGSGWTKNLAPLLLQLASGDASGLYIDGTTNDFSTSGVNPAALEVYRDVDYGTGNFGTQAFACVNKLQHLSANAKLTAHTTWFVFYNNYVNLGQLTNATASNWNYNFYACGNRIDDSGTYDTASTGRFFYYPVGFSASLYVTPTFTDSGGSASGTARCICYGQRIVIQNQPVLTSGSLTAQSFGLTLKVQGNTVGTSAGYGIYIEQVSGSDQNYAIWDASGADWVLDADNQKIRLGASQGDFDLYSDGFNAQIDSWGDIFLNASGNVKFGTYAAITTEVPTGYIVIKDSAGNLRKLLVGA